VAEPSRDVNAKPDNLEEAAIESDTLLVGCYGDV